MRNNYRKYSSEKKNVIVTYRSKFALLCVLLDWGKFFVGCDFVYLLVIVVFLMPQDCRALYFRPFCLVSRTFSCNLLGKKYDSRQL